MTPNTRPSKIMSHEERLALIYTPFPIIKISSPRGNSQAPRLTPEDDPNNPIREENW